MALTFQEYRTRRIVNVHRRVDPWFWDKYSATPYVGCRSGCVFCYLRGQRYLGNRSPETFDTLIGVKVNAVERLKKELPRLERDIICCGDWQQPAEARYRLSRSMLEVVLEANFPALIIERSPLLLRDVDLLEDLHRRSWLGILISISSVDPEIKRAFEPRSPGIKRRLQMMETLAQRGILVGAALMPVFPFIGDDDRSLRETIQAVRDHGASFVLAGTLTMDGPQAERTLQVVRERWPSLEAKWRELYRWEHGKAPAYSPPPEYTARLGRKVREICQQLGLKDRMPRYVVPGPLAVNKQVAEYLHLKAYDLEIEEATRYRIWAYKKAAWSIEDWGENILEKYNREGETGLQTIPCVGTRLAGEIARWLREQYPLLCNSEAA